MTNTPLNTSVQAQYADGFVLDETEQNDISPYTKINNTFNDILEKRAEAEHGAMVRFSVFYKDARYDVDWTTLPDNARPIRFRHGFITLAADSQTEQGWSGISFGYQYNDENGKNIQEIQEIK